MPVTGSTQVFRKVLTLGSALIAGIGVLGAVVGWFVAGGNGVLSALIGAGMTLVFVSLTAVSVSFGGKLNLGGFFGLVLGAWILKLVLFMVLILVLKQATFVAGPVLFGTLVAAILTSLGLDSWVFLKARLPYGE